MYEDRETVVDEFLCRLLEVIYQPRKDCKLEEAELFVQDLKMLFLDKIPKSMTVPQIRELCEQTRLRLRATYKFSRWPSVKEILEAQDCWLKKTKPPRSESREPDWPHVNSKKMVVRTKSFIKTHNKWPYYHSPKSDLKIAEEIVSEGEYDWDDLKKLGFERLPLI
ncbi:MAG: hypothetical protein AAFN27_20560 [Pseudomonadota bacterium]